MATRTHDQGRAVWTLLPIAVRIAQALSLPNDIPKETFFNQQMRSRLWYTICLLDLQSSIDRASEPLISPTSNHPTPPLNINDSDFTPTSQPIPERHDLTDMTFALILFHAQRTAKLLNFAAPSTITDIPARHAAVAQFEVRTAALLRAANPAASAYAWFVLTSSSCLAACLRLSALRPLQRGAIGQPRPPGSSHLLVTSTEVLQKVHILKTDPRGERFRWFEVAQWYALAVAITECYVCEDLAHVERLWPLVEECYRYLEAVVADSAAGGLWAPMRRLMEVVRERVVKGQRGKSESVSSVGGVVRNTQNSRSQSVSTNNATPQNAVTHLPTGVQQGAHHVPTLSARDVATSHGGVADAGVPDVDMFIDPQYTGCAPSSTSFSNMSSDAIDPAWLAWEDFLNGISPGDVDMGNTRVGTGSSTTSGVAASSSTGSVSANQPSLFTDSGYPSNDLFQGRMHFG